MTGHLTDPFKASNQRMRQLATERIKATGARNVPVSVPAWALIELIDNYKLVEKVLTPPVLNYEADCPWCATWLCAACGWIRRRANPVFKHTCRKCGSVDGSLVPTRHADRAVHDAHKAAAAAAATAGPDTAKRHK